MMEPATPDVGSESPSPIERHVQPQITTAPGSSDIATTSNAPAEVRPPATNLQRLAEWFKENVAHRYFFEDDAASKQILEAVLMANVEPTFDVPDEDIVIPTLNADTPDDERIHAICEALFLRNAGDQSTTIPRNIEAVCEIAKNECRRERHRHINRALRQQLRDALAVANERQAETIRNGIEGLAATAYQQLRDFGHRYRDVIGARPFLRGLRQLLTRQLTEVNLVCWRLHEASLTEVSDGFIEDAVVLLVNTMQLGSNFDAETTEAMYMWTLPAWTNDRMLRQLIGCLPRGDGRPGAGDIVVTGIARQHPPEVARGFRAYVARFCNIL